MEKWIAQRVVLLPYLLKCFCKTLLWLANLITWWILSHTHFAVECLSWCGHFCWGYWLGVTHTVAASAALCSLSFMMYYCQIPHHKAHNCVGAAGT